MNTGAWEIKVSKNYPQRIATAVSGLNEKLVGASYDAIAYIGSQTVNGVNHAVLAEQTVLTGKDTKNIVLLIFNEKPGEVEATLVGIERVIEGSEAFGGMKINVQTDLSEDIQNIWTNAFEGYVGAKVKPFAFLGEQVTKGTDYVFAATVEGVVPNPVAKAVVVTINPMTEKTHFADLMTAKQDASLGYAFSW